jgi:hypothetical protein
MVVMGALSFVSLLAAIFTVRHLRRRCRRRRLVIFLSYRVRSDAAVVARLYEMLRQEGCHVWWDKVCLPKGVPWEEGFVDGLLGARIFVPIISRAALENFATLDMDSPCDNVLLEYRLALELQARKRIQRIFPVFLGTPEGGGDSLPARFGESAPGQLLPHSPNVLVNAVETKLHEHLKRMAKSSRGSHQRLLEKRGPQGATVKNVVDAITINQGELVHGDCEAALLRLVRSILRMVDELAAARSSNTPPPPPLLNAGEETPKERSVPRRSLGSFSMPRRQVRPIVQQYTTDSVSDEVGLARLPSLSDLGSASSGLAAQPATSVNKFDFSSFVSSPIGADRNAHQLNPVLMAKAEQQRKKDMGKSRLLPGQHRAGGLRRLDPSEGGTELSPEGTALRNERYLDTYLARMHGVQRSYCSAASSSSPTEAQEAALALHQIKRQANEQHQHVVNQQMVERLRSARRSSMGASSPSSAVDERGVFMRDGGRSRAQGPDGLHMTQL